MKRRLLSALLALCMVLTMAPTVAFAAEGDVTSGAQQTNGPVYDLSDDTAARTVSTDCTLTGSTKFPVTIDGSTNGITVTLKDVTIDSSSIQGKDAKAAITVQGNVTLVLEGENTLKGGTYSLVSTETYGRSGINIKVDASLTIAGTGKIDVYATAGNREGSGADAIGGLNQKTFGGNFILNSGTVNAYGANGASGLDCENITINGGILNAYASYDEFAAGGTAIGGANTEKVAINGGTVIAKSQNKAGGIESAALQADNILISGGSGGASGNGGIRGDAIEISGNAVVDAESTKSFEGIGIVATAKEKKIVIKDNAEVCAKGGADGAGIGGSAAYIEISGSASVTA